MRLIDADAIIYDEREPDVLAVTEYDIESTPTIEAIPVEWIEEWYKKKGSKPFDVMDVSVRLLLRDWREEHETD